MRQVNDIADSLNTQIQELISSVRKAEWAVFIEHDKITDDDLYLAYYRLMPLNHEYSFDTNTISAKDTRLCFEFGTVGDQKVLFFRTYYNEDCKIDDLDAKIRQHRYLIALLRHHFGGSHLKENERAALFVWIMDEEEPDYIKRRYQLNCYSARTGNRRRDDGKYLRVIVGINHGDKFVYENNIDTIKAMADEMWDKLE